MDAAGIPVDPPGPHRDEGCRIGQRLDVLLEQRDSLLAACQDYLHYVAGKEITIDDIRSRMKQAVAKTKGTV